MKHPSSASTTPVTPLDSLLLVLRIAISSVLLYAGFMKAMAPAAEFAAQIHVYQMLPRAALTPLAFALPWIELWVGLFLLTGLFTRQAALAASGLFTMFIGAIAMAFYRGIDLKDCGCFGSGNFPPQITIMMDVTLLCACAIVIWKSVAPRPYTLDKKLN